MARTYTQVLEEVVKNQAVQIAQFVAQNEELTEQNRQLAERLNALLNSNSDISKSGGRVFDFEKALSEADPKPEPATGTD